MNKVFFLVMFFIVFSCSNNKDGNANTTNTNTNSTTGNESNTGTAVTSSVEDGPAIGTLQTENYTAKVHRVIPFVAKKDEMDLFKVKDGHQFLVLDMSVRNTSDQPIEMGNILLETKVKDENGRDIELSVLAVGAYTYTYSIPGHQQQYDALWSKMNPGDFYRAAVLGLEAPKDVKTLTLSMPVKDGFEKDTPRKELKVSL
jgi:hypothetical protein